MTGRVARRRAAPRGWRAGFVLPGGIRVVPGAEHWELVLEHGRVSPAQLAWLERAGVGIRAIGRRPGPGRPWWEELLPSARGRPARPRGRRLRTG